MTDTLVVTITEPMGTAVIAPIGLSTPHATAHPAEVAGAHVRRLTCSATGQPVLHLTTEAPEVLLTYTYGPATATDTYQEELFRPTDSRFTRAAEALLEEAAEMARGETEVDRARAIARGTAERFTYGHPEERFTDGLDHVPALGCDIAEGSCVDINTYFIAALRACGISAGYVVGAFIPEEKGDWCEDMHCWVVTRIDGETQEWDIAHHLKLGTRDIAPGLNPKPGRRFAVGHSMGLALPDLGIADLKLLSSPLVPAADGRGREANHTIRLRIHAPA